MLFFHALQIWIWIWKDSIEYLIPGKNWNISYARAHIYVCYSREFCLDFFSVPRSIWIEYVFVLLTIKSMNESFSFGRAKKIQPLFSRASAPHLWLVMATFALSKENIRKIYEVNGFECRRIESKTAAKRIEPKMLGVYICGPTRG